MTGYAGAAFITAGLVSIARAAGAELPAGPVLIKTFVPAGASEFYTGAGWLPDGSGIILSKRTGPLKTPEQRSTTGLIGDGWQLLKSDLSGKSPDIVANGIGGNRLLISPSGEWMAVRWDATVWLLGLTGNSATMIIPDCDAFLAWSPSGRYLTTSAHSEDDCPKLSILDVQTRRVVGDPCGIEIDWALDESGALIQSEGERVVGLY